LTNEKFVAMVLVKTGVGISNIFERAWRPLDEKLRANRALRSHMWAMVKAVATFPTQSAPSTPQEVIAEFPSRPTPESTFVVASLGLRAAAAELTTIGAQLQV
jgi:hypothetical protein